VRLFGLHSGSEHFEEGSDLLAMAAVEPVVTVKSLQTRFVDSMGCLDCRRTVSLSRRTWLNGVS
jgi:hypothetical protein